MNAAPITSCIANPDSVGAVIVEVLCPFCGETHTHGIGKPQSAIDGKHLEFALSSCTVPPDPPDNSYMMTDPSLLLEPFL